MPVNKFDSDDRILAFVENVANGLTPNAAARAAGYVDYEKDGKRLMKHDFVNKMLAFAASQSSKKKQITREKVHEMVLEAFDIAKMSSDAGSMVRAAGELSKMNGFYEPQRVQLDMNVNMQQTQAALATMSDEELLRIAEGDVIEGEVERVEG